MTTARALITIPSKERIGLFPCMIVLITGGLAFYLSFQNFFFDLSYALTTQLFLDPGVLDTLMVIGLPCSLLYCFVVSQLRTRMSWRLVNPWSITHLIFFALSFIMCICYIVARPTQCTNFMKTVMDNESLNFNGLVNFCRKLCPENSNLWKSFNDPTYKTYNFSMHMASWSFTSEFLIALIFSALQCANFGEQDMVVTIKDSGDGNFLVLTEEPSVTFSKKRAQEVQKMRETMDSYTVPLSPACSTTSPRSIMGSP